MECVVVCSVAVEVSHDSGLVKCSAPFVRSPTLVIGAAPCTSGAVFLLTQALPSPRMRDDGAQVASVREPNLLAHHPVLSAPCPRASYHSRNS